MMSGGTLSKRSLMKGGLATAALAHLPVRAGSPGGDTVSEHLPGIEVLTPDGRAVRIDELLAGRGFDPSVRRFLIAELAARTTA